MSCSDTLRPIIRRFDVPMVGKFSVKYNNFKAANFVCNFLTTLENNIGSFKEVSVLSSNFGIVSVEIRRLPLQKFVDLQIFQSYI